MGQEPARGVVHCYARLVTGSLDAEYPHRTSGAALDG
jgi:hypothetical protein